MHTDVRGELKCEHIPSHQYAPPPAHVPFIATRDNCRSSLSRPSLHLLILASSPTSSTSTLVCSSSMPHHLLSHSLPALVLIPNCFLEYSFFLFLFYFLEHSFFLQHHRPRGGFSSFSFLCLEHPSFLQ